MSKNSENVKPRDMLKSRAGRAVRVICISVSALNLIGIFFLGGFFSKDIFLMLSFSKNYLYSRESVFLNTY